MLYLNYLLYSISLTHCFGQIHAAYTRPLIDNDFLIHFGQTVPVAGRTMTKTEIAEFPHVPQEIATIIKNYAIPWEMIDVLRISLNMNFKSAAISPEEDCIATVDHNNIGTLWSTETGGIIPTLDTAQTTIVRLAKNTNLSTYDVNEEKSLIVTGSNNGKMQLWDADTGNLLYESTIAFAKKVLVSISHDGTFILATCDNHSPRIYPIGTRLCAASKDVSLAGIALLNTLTTSADQETDFLLNHAQAIEFAALPKHIRKEFCSTVLHP